MRRLQIVDFAACHLDHTSTTTPIIPPELQQLYLHTGNQLTAFQDQNPLGAYMGQYQQNTAPLTYNERLGAGMAQGLGQQSPYDALALQYALSLPGQAGAGPTTGYGAGDGMSLQDLFSAMGGWNGANAIPYQGFDTMTGLGPTSLPPHTNPPNGGPRTNGGNSDAGAGNPGPGGPGAGGTRTVAAAPPALETLAAPAMPTAAALSTSGANADAAARLNGLVSSSDYSPYLKSLGLSNPAATLGQYGLNADATNWRAAATNAKAAGALPVGFDASGRPVYSSQAPSAAPSMYTPDGKVSSAYVRWRQDQSLAGTGQRAALGGNIAPPIQGSPSPQAGANTKMATNPTATYASPTAPQLPAPTAQRSTVLPAAGTATAAPAGVATPAAPAAPSLARGGATVAPITRQQPGQTTGDGSAVVIKPGPGQGRDYTQYRGGIGSTSGGGVVGGNWVGPTPQPGPTNAGLAALGSAQAAGQRDVGATPFWASPGILSASQRVTGQSIQDDPAVKAALDNFQLNVAPGLENQAALAGLGRSTALMNSFARGKAAVLEPQYEAAQAREQQRIQNITGATESELGRRQASDLAKAQATQSVIPLLMQMGQNRQSNQQSAIDALMNTGAAQRGVQQQAYGSQYQDFLRRQALAEQGLFAPFGQLSNVGTQTQSK